MKFLYSSINMKERISFLGCMLFLTLSANAQNGHLQGFIKTSDGKPAAEVYVQLKETRKGTISKADGSYQLSNIPEGKYTIIVSFVGLQAIQKPVVVTSGTTNNLDFSLVENETQLAEIVVTANRSMNERPASIGKLPIKPMDLPQAVVTVGESVIKNQQAQRLSDVIKNVNGVYLGTARASTQEAFYARGYSFSSTNMFKNGSRVNSGAMPEVSSLESVEILKGGAAILYGNVAPGGVLNMVTKKPKFELGGEVSLRAGSYNLFKPTFDIYGPISNKVAYRVNGTFESADSYRDQVSSKRYYVNPSLLFKLGNKTELIVEGDYLKHEFTPDFGIGSLNDSTKGTRPSSVPDVPRSRFMGTPWQYNTTDQSTASVTLNHSFNTNWKLNTVVSYQQFKRDYYAVERIQALYTPLGDWARPLGRVDTKEKYFTGQVNLNGNFKTGKVEHILLAGVDADRYMTNTYNYDIQGKIYDTINILDPNKYTPRTDIPVATRLTFVETPVNRFGAYVQDLISLSPKIKLLAGVRWSLQESPAATTTYLQKNDSIAKGKFASANAFSPRFGLVYRFKPNVSFFASYSNSFSVNTGLDIYNNVLPPSIIDQYELGVKNIFLDGRLTVNLTAYKIINNNLAQTAQFDKDGNLNSNSNLKELTGQTTSNGVELDVMANFMKGLSVMAGYSYNNMEYTKTPGNKGSYREGERLVNSPAHTANASVFYTFSHGALNRLKLGAAVYYAGDRFGGWNNTIEQSQNYSRLIPVDGFTTIDISAGYSIKRFSLLAKLSNLTNTYNYYVHENYSINPIAPRQLIATVAYKF
ncbi:TonB-dependent receptor [Terrimonas pollutisoli]|uniref:TonB-dependent receptor n=1 Tax=Terrimonas pollutisoli TaxID=3034147 RepID=UPI0023EDF083|nr:TonB-dependent receptor [Terrimonas sp. H1YJ31]